MSHCKPRKRDPVTRREKQVIKLIVEGHNNESISHQLDISIHTVKMHIRSALEKQGCSGRVELAVKAVTEHYEAKIRSMQCSQKA